MNQKGFAAPIILGIVALILIAGTAGYLVWERVTSQQATTTNGSVRSATQETRQTFKGPGGIYSVILPKDWEMQPRSAGTIGAAVFASASKESINGWPDIEITFGDFTTTGNKFSLESVAPLFFGVGKDAANATSSAVISSLYVGSNQAIVLDNGKTVSKSSPGKPIKEAVIDMGDVVVYVNSFSLMGDEVFQKVLMSMQFPPQKFYWRNLDLSQTMQFNDSARGVSFTYPTFGNNDTASTTINTDSPDYIEYDISFATPISGLNTVYFVTVSKNKKQQSLTDWFSSTASPELITYGTFAPRTLGNGMKALVWTGRGVPPNYDQGPISPIFVMSTSTKSIVSLETSNGGTGLPTNINVNMFDYLLSIAESLQVP